MKASSFPCSCRSCIPYSIILAGGSGISSCLSIRIASLGQPAAHMPQPMYFSISTSAISFVFTSFKPGISCQVFKRIPYITELGVTGTTDFNIASNGTVGPYFSSSFPFVTHCKPTGIIPTINEFRKNVLRDCKSFFPLNAVGF